MREPPPPGTPGIVHGIRRSVGSYTGQCFGVGQNQTIHWNRDRRKRRKKLQLPKQLQYWNCGEFNQFLATTNASENAVVKDGKMINTNNIFTVKRLIWNFSQQFEIMCMKTATLKKIFWGNLWCKKKCGEKTPACHQHSDTLVAEHPHLLQAAQFLNTDACLEREWEREGNRGR